MIKPYKVEMRSKARSIRGLANILINDSDYIFADVEDYDLVGLEVSLREAKETLQSLMDNVTELEYALYLSKQKNA